MRILGIDYGTKRIGLAISDENSNLAFPKEILINDTNIFSKLKQVLEEDEISEIVVGESVDFFGKPNPLATKIEVFIEELKGKFGLPIHKQKEFLTSVEARKSGNSKKTFNQSQAHSRIKKNENNKVDAKAAALLLQRYLDLSVQVRKKGSVG